MNPLRLLATVLPAHTLLDGPRPAGPRTVVVSGASAGIGRAAAVAFAARGDRVALPARGEAGLKAASPWPPPWR